MWKKFFSNFLFGIFIILNTNLAFSASFSANVLWKMEGKPDRVSKLYVSDNLYRFDTVEDEQSLGFIVDQKKDKAVVLNLTERVYSEVSRADLMFSNPFEAHFAMKSMYKIVDEGEEMVNGIECYKRTLKTDDIIVQRIWIAKKYNFPVKIINYSGDKEYMLVELSNIKEEEVDKNIFTVPEDFKLMQMPSGKTEPPSWKRNINQAPLVEIPTEMRLSEGKSIRIKTVKDSVLSITMKNLSSEDTVVKFDAFKSGVPLEKYTGYQFNKEGKKQFKESPEEADEIGIHVKRGEILLKAEQTGAYVYIQDKLKAGAGKEYDLYKFKRKKIRLRLIDDAKDGKDSEGIIAIRISEAVKESGAVYYRPKTVKEIQFKILNGGTEVWELSEYVNLEYSVYIDLTKGRIKVQFEDASLP